MTGEDMPEVFEAILPQQDIEPLCAPCGVIERQRQLHLGMVVRALVMAAGTPGGAYQADMLRSYLEFAVPQMARSAFYRWFDEPRERFMGALADRALAYTRAQQVDLTGMLGGVKAWSIVASTTARVRGALRDEFPGTGDDAALKGHKILSVGCGAPVCYHCSPAQEHDRRHLQIDETWQGCGLLADLAYASLARLQACHVYNVRFVIRFVIRLKDNWEPKGDHMAHGQVTQEFFPGSDLDALLDGHILALDGRAIAANVRVGNAKHPRHLRPVGVNTPKGYCFFLTTLPPMVGPQQVVDLYRVRWEVELSMTLDKSVHRLDPVDAERPWSAQTLLQASLIVSLIAVLLAHRHHKQTRPSQEGMARTEAPLHPGRLALKLAVSCQAMAQALDLRGTAAKRRRQQIAALLTHSGQDPNGRRRPLVLDQLCGWKRQLVARKLANHGHLKAVA